MTKNNEELEEVLISKSQYSALNDIRGLAQDAFYMIVGAKEYSNGFLLKGKPEVFSSMVSDLYDEVGIVSKSKAKTLQALLRKLEPGYEEF